MSKGHPLVFYVYSIPSSRAKGEAQAQVSTHDEQYISPIYLELVLFLIQQLNATDTNTRNNKSKHMLKLLKQSNQQNAPFVNSTRSAVLTKS